MIKHITRIFLSIGTILSTVETALSISLHSASETFQGSRPYQQDRFYVAKSGIDHGLLAAIFDGHGDNGDVYAEHAKNLFVEKFAHYDNELEASSDPIAIIKTIYKEVNKALLPLYKKGNQGGTTALAVYKKRDSQHVYISHCGDSRAVWGDTKRTQTADHTASNTREVRRVGRKNVVNVHGVPRLGGNLMITRSLADFPHKKIGLSATPEIRRIALAHYPFMILGCDGIWDGTSKKLSRRSEQNDDNTLLYTILRKTLTQASGSVQKRTELALKRVIAVTICSTLDEAQKPKLLYSFGKLKSDISQEELISFTLNTSEQFLDTFIAKNSKYLHDNTTAIILNFGN